VYKVLTSKGKAATIAAEWIKERARKEMKEQKKA